MVCFKYLGLPLLVGLLVSRANAGTYGVYEFNNFEIILLMHKFIIKFIYDQLVLFNMMEVLSLLQDVSIIIIKIDISLYINKKK